MRLPEIHFELYTATTTLTRFVASHSPIFTHNKIILVVTDSRLSEIFQPIIESIELQNNVQCLTAFVDYEPDTNIISTVINLIDDSVVPLIIGIGGGSVLDTTKIVASLSSSRQPLETFLQHPQQILNRNIPMALVPTLIGTGAELSCGVSLRFPSGKKGALGNPSFLTDLVIYDASICSTAPQAIAFACVADAFSHALESLVSRNATTWSRRTAQGALERIIESTELISSNPNSYEGWEDLIISTIEASVSLSVAGGGIGHALAYEISDYANLSHGNILARLLPNLIRFYSESGLIEDRLAQILTNETTLLSFCKNLEPFPLNSEIIDTVCANALENTRLINNHPSVVSFHQLRNIVLQDNTLEDTFKKGESHVCEENWKTINNGNDASIDCN